MNNLPAEKEWLEFRGLKLTVPPPDQGTGCLPRDSKPGEFFPLCSDARVKKYPRTLWESYARKNRTAGRYTRHVYNQGPNGSCCPSMWIGGWFCVAGMHFGVENIPPHGLSCIPMYKRLVNSPNQGVSLDRCAREFQQVGTLPLDTTENKLWMEARGLNPEHVAPESRWSWQEPRGTEETKKHFRIGEIEDLPRYDDVYSASCDGLPVAIGYSGHAVLVIDLNKDSIGKMDYLNTWNRWGLPLDPDTRFIQYGRGVVSERELGPQIYRYGAFAFIRVYESPILAA